MPIRLVIAGLLAALFALPGFAQTTLDEITAQLDSQTSELEQVDALLADPDPNRRIAAMELLLESGNPVFVSRATEAGLFSSDTEMQAAALAAIFDAGGPFKLVIDMTAGSEDETGIKRWIGPNGSWDEAETEATYIFRTDPYAPEGQCWPVAGEDRCSIRMSGRTVSINDWRNTAGTFELNASGVLVGSMRYTNGTYNAAPATIPLIE